MLNLNSCLIRNSIAMSRILALILMSFGSLLVSLILIRLIFKNSIVGMIGFLAMVFAIVSGVCFNIVGQKGTSHLWWAAPVVYLLGIWFLFVMNKKLAQPLMKNISNLKRLSEGELSISGEKLDDRSEIGILNNSILELTNQLKTIVGEIKSSAGQLSMSSNQLGAMSEEISSGASEQASSLEELSATLEELSGTLEANMSKAKHAGEIVSQSQQLVSGVVNGSKELIESYKNISGKVQHINDISFQTNILALNAAVEAARAGDAGRGFAVVADEVRKLADTSNTLASGILQVSDSSTIVVKYVESEISEMLPKINQSTSLVSEIVQSTVEQTIGVALVSDSIQYMNQVTQQNAASSEEMAAGSEELSAQADSLNKLIAFFKF